MMRIKKVPIYTSDSYWKAREGKFILGRVEYTALLGFGEIVTYLQRSLSGKEFVFEVLSWRYSRRVFNKPFMPKYILRPMWECAAAFQHVQDITRAPEMPDSGLGTPMRVQAEKYLRVQHCWVIQELSHGDAMDKARQLGNFYMPRRALDLNA